MSASLIGWLVSLLFIVFLVCGFFTGFWRGLKHSTLNLVISIIGLVVAFFITPPITNAILGIMVSYDGSMMPIKEVLAKLLTTQPDIEKLTTANPNLLLVVEELPGAIANTIVFILVTMIIELLFYVIYKIFACCVFKKGEGKQKRVLGGAVGLVKTFVMALLLFMPLAGLAGLASTYTYSSDYGIEVVSEVGVSEGESLEGGTNAGETTAKKDYGILGRVLNDNVNEAIRGLENNMLIKCCGIFGLDNAMFDYYSQVKVGGGTLYVRQELENLYPVADMASQLSNVNVSNVDYTKLNYEKLEKSLDKLTSSPLFKDVLTVSLTDIIVNYQSYSFMNSLPTTVVDIIKDVGASLEQLSESGEEYIYFKNDIMTAYDIVRNLGENGVINDITALENKSLNNVIDTLTSTSNLEHFESQLRNIFELNIVKDSIKTLANTLVDQLSSDLEKVAIDGKSFTEEDWDNVSASFVRIAKNFVEIDKTISLSTLMSDFTVLLDSESNYDIDKLTDSVGIIIDELISNKLLKNSENKPIISSLLEKNNFSLPSSPVKDIEGREINITNYQTLMNFVSPALKSLRDEGIYDLLNGGNDVILNIAGILSETDKENLLVEILIPLVQVEPTKTLIVDNLSSSLSGDILSIAGIEGYDEWKEELTTISQTLVKLNNYKIGGESYLEKLLNEGAGYLIDNFTDEQVDDIISNLLPSKAFSPMTSSLFSSLKQELENIIGSEIILSTQNASFKGQESETNEVCKIIKSLIHAKKELSGNTLKTMNKTILASLLNDMKYNAYRVELSSKTKAGIFKDAFVSLVDKFKSEYQAEVTYIESQPTLLEELGVENLQEESYKSIDYQKLLDMITQAENA